MEGKEIDVAFDAAAKSALDMHLNNKTFNDTYNPLIADLLKIALGSIFNEINKLNSANEKKLTDQIDSLNKEIASLKQYKAMHPTQPFSTTIASVIKGNYQQNVYTGHSS